MPGKFINLAAGDELKEMDFALARAGVVTGRVLDPEGRPAVEEHVTLILADPKERKASELHGPRIYQTDDRGVYRVWDLAPGRYLVYAGRSSENNYARGGGDAGGFYPQTFHPSVAEESEARVIEVTTGSVAEDIDITLGKLQRTYKASGRVLDEDGRPLPGVNVEVGSLSNDGKQVFGNISDVGLSDERGEFSAEGLMPGRWGVWGTDGQPFAGKQGSTYGDMATFDISERDVSGLEIKMYRGASVSGVVSIEGTSDPAILARRSELKLWVHVDAPPGTATMSNFARSGVKPDGTFEFKGLPPGKARFNLDWPQPKGFSLHSLKRDGIELPNGLEVRKAEQVKNVQVSLAYGTSVVRGQVQVRGGARPASARLFAQARRPGTNIVTGGGAVDELGRFVIENLSAGEYELQLMDYTTPDMPEERRRLALQTINVPEGGELKVTLTYDVSPAPKEQDK